MPASTPNSAEAAFKAHTNIAQIVQKKHFSLPFHCEQNIFHKHA